MNYTGGKTQISWDTSTFPVITTPFDGLLIFFPRFNHVVVTTTNIWQILMLRPKSSFVQIIHVVGDEHGGGAEKTKPHELQKYRIYNIPILISTKLIIIIITVIISIIVTTARHPCSLFPKTHKSFSYQLLLFIIPFLIVRTLLDNSIIYFIF